MKKVFLFLFLSLGLSLDLYASGFKLDQKHTQVGFSVAHLKVSSVAGRFNKFEGSFDYDTTSGELSNLSAKIETESIDTNEADRDKHLRSPDFFNVAKFPTMTFTSAQKLKIKEGGKANLEGVLTLLGKEGKVTLALTHKGLLLKDMQGNTRVGFEATGMIKRKDYGMVWNKILDTGALVVGDEVEIKIQGEAIMVKEPTK